MRSLARSLALSHHPPHRAAVQHPVAPPKYIQCTPDPWCCICLPGAHPLQTATWHDHDTPHSASTNTLHSLTHQPATITVAMLACTVAPSRCRPIPVNARTFPGASLVHTPCPTGRHSAHGQPLIAVRGTYYSGPHIAVVSGEQTARESVPGCPHSQTDWGSGSVAQTACCSVRPVCLRCWHVCSRRAWCCW